MRQLFFISAMDFFNDEVILNLGVKISSSSG